MIYNNTGRLFVYLTWILLTSICKLQSQVNDLPNAEACCSSLLVSDLDRAAAWYADALKFDPGIVFENTERGIRIANLKQGSTRLELIELSSSVHPDSLDLESKMIQGFFKFGMRVKEFDSWMAHLKKHDPGIESRVVFDPLTQKRMVVMRDLDGNRLQFFEE